MIIEALCFIHVKIVDCALKTLHLGTDIKLWHTISLMGGWMKLGARKYAQTMVQYSGQVEVLLDIIVMYFLKNVIMYMLNSYFTKTNKHTTT